MAWRSQRWDELDPAKQVAIMLLVSVKVASTVAAWSDLAARPADQIRGSKRRWAFVIAIDLIGPLLYWRRGRLDAPAGAPTPSG